MSAEEVDQYLSQLDEPKRATLEGLRATILSIIPDAEQGLSYSVPVFRLQGQRVAGFSAAKQHVSYLPHSGAVLGRIDPDELAGFSASKGALKIPIGATLPVELVRRLIAERCQEAGILLITALVGVRRRR